VNFHEWSVEALSPADRPRDNEAFIRLIASFSTKEADVNRFASLLDPAGSLG
jgi:hypothetical protein